MRDRQGTHAHSARGMRPARPTLWPRVAIFSGLVAFAALVAWWSPTSMEQALDWGERLAERPITAVAVVLAQALLLTFALPGTLMLWVVAPFYPPLVATALLSIGTFVGALGAYAVARRFGVRDHSVEGAVYSGDSMRARGIALMRRHSDVWMQLAFRILPVFPHSVINHGAGLLALPLRPFLIAAAVGVPVKWLVYTHAVHAMVQIGIEDEPLSVWLLSPLLALALLLIVGIVVRGWWLRRRSGAAETRPDNADHQTV